MYLDRKALREYLFGLVGFYNTSNPDYPSLIPSLLESRSGRVINEVNELITIENIDQSIKNFSNYIYDEYSVTTEYQKGDKVKDVLNNNYEYINELPSTGNLPTDPIYWAEIDNISDYLIKQVYAGVDDMMQAWIDDKKIRTIVKSIYDDIYLFNGVANTRSLIVNADKFVGLRFRMKRGERSLVVLMRQLGHQFNNTFNGLTMYLYHSSQEQPVLTFDINQTKANSSQWTNFPSDTILRYISEEYDAGGDFYLGYKQSDLEALGGSALRKDVAWQEAPCTCEDLSYSYYQQYSPFLDVVGFEVDESDMPNDELFDPSDIGTSYTSNYGLNINMTSACDIGYFVQKNEFLFAEALNNAIGYRLVKAMSGSTRGANQIANQVKAEAKKELYSHDGAWGTVTDRYKASIKALSFDLSGLGEECFPCDDHDDIQIGTVTLG